MNSKACFFGRSFNKQINRRITFIRLPTVKHNRERSLACHTKIIDRPRWRGSHNRTLFSTAWTGTGATYNHRRCLINIKSNERACYQETWHQNEMSKRNKNRNKSQAPQNCKRLAGSLQSLCLAPMLNEDDTSGASLI